MLCTEIGGHCRAPGQEGALPMRLLWLWFQWLHCSCQRQRPMMDGSLGPSLRPAVTRSRILNQSYRPFASRPSAQVGCHSTDRRFGRPKVRSGQVSTMKSQVRCGPQKHAKSKTLTNIRKTAVKPQINSNEVRKEISWAFYE